MSTTLRAVMALSIVAVVAACNKPQADEPVYVTEPVHTGPVYTGKYR